MTKDMLSEFFSRCILPLYPKAADNVDNCLLIKIDSGPGRMHPPMLRMLRSHGGHLHPGLPNGTEAGQECDQLFGYFKKMIYSNRKKLWSSRFRLEGESASLSLSDLACMVFGGTVTLIDGSSLELENAWELAFDSAHIHAAMDKCGYCPSTRVALKATQIRHEIIENEDGSIDEVEDPHGALLDELERQNRAAVDTLMDNGHELAENLLRKAKRVTADQVRGRASVITEPNTIERQEALMGASTAGGYFQITNGGGPMTSDDALIAFAKKDMLKEVEELEKKKKKCGASDVVSIEATEIMSKGKSPKDWKKSELQTMMRWKQGSVPTPPYNDSSQVKKPVLLKLWEDKYEQLDVQAGNGEWTEADERRLEQARNGDINCFSADVGLDRCMATEDEYLVNRLLSFDRDRRTKIISKVDEGLGEED